MKEKFMFAMLILTIIVSPFVISHITDLKNDMEECQELSGGRYWYLSGEQCCITSSSGWYEPEEGSVTKFIFGNNKRWREFDCKELP